MSLRVQGGKNSTFADFKVGANPSFAKPSTYIYSLMYMNKKMSIQRASNMMETKILKLISQKPTFFYTLSITI